MGVGPSLLLPPVLNSVKNWSWARVLNVLKDYADKDLDFGLDAQTIASFTGLTSEEAREVVQLLSRSEGSSAMLV